MNGNRMSPFVKFPEYNLGPMAQQPRPLVSMGQVMEGERIDPFQRAMPAPAMTPAPRQDKGQPPQGKKIMGMPKDRFIALMGSIAQAFGGDSASGRMGANLINMAEMMRTERVGQAEARAGTAETRRKEAREDAQERRKTAATRKGKAPTVKTFRVGDMDVQHSYDYNTGEWEPIPGMPGKKVKEEKKEEKVPTVKPFRIGDRDIPHTWNSVTGKFEPIPGMPGKKVKPVAEEKPKKMTFAEKRARAKSAKDSEAIILNSEYQTLEYQDELQVEIDNFDRFSDKSYTYLIVPGKVVSWGRDVQPKRKKIDISTPEKIRDSDLPVDRKLRLLRSRFGFE